MFAAIELIALACAAMLFVIMNSAASMLRHLRRIDKKLTVMVPDPPPEPYFKKPAPVIIKKRPKTL